MFSFSDHQSKIVVYVLQDGFLYLYFVSGILLSISQLSGFVPTGLSLGGQLKNKK